MSTFLPIPFSDRYFYKPVIWRFYYLKSELMYCKSRDQVLISILCRSTDSFYSSSISRDGQTLPGSLVVVNHVGISCGGQTVPRSLMVVRPCRDFEMYDTPHKFPTIYSTISTRYRNLERPRGPIYAI